MPTVTYARITVTVIADEEKANGPDEMKLSDELYEIERQLEEWLKGKSENFVFEVEDH